MSMHKGGCQCGAIRFSFEGDPVRFSACHCRMCQRATGNAFAPLVEVEAERVSWEGDAPKIYASSNIAERGFCGQCGAPVFFRSIEGDTVEFMIGGFDEPDAFKLDYHYGAESMRGWLKLDDGLERKPTCEADLTKDGRAVISHQFTPGET